MNHWKKTEIKLGLLALFFIVPNIVHAQHEKPDRDVPSKEERASWVFTGKKCTDYKIVRYEWKTDVSNCGYDSNDNARLGLYKILGAWCSDYWGGRLTRGSYWDEYKVWEGTCSN